MFFLIDSFSIKVIASFLVGGAWITLATVLSERLGSRIGGLLASLPSTMVVALVFLAVTKDDLFAAHAAEAVPLGMLVSTVSLFTYVALVKRLKVLAALPALGAWVVLAYSTSTTKISLAESIGAYAVATGILLAVLDKKFSIKSVGPKKLAYPPSTLFVRAVFAGSVVASAVVAGTLLGPVWGGLFSVFPAAWLSTMAITTRSLGAEFAQAMGKTMLPAGAASVVYGLAVSFAYPAFGLVAGTVIAYALAAFLMALIYPFLKKIS